MGSTMKNKISPLWLLRFAVLLLFLVGGLTIGAHKAMAAGDLDDVEADVDSVTSESDAEQNEAVDAKKRADKEKENLKKAKKEAQETKKDAETKGEAAKKEIALLDANTRANQKARARLEKDKAFSLKMIERSKVRLAKKKDDLAKSTAELAAAKTEKETQDKNLLDLQNQEKTTKESIARDRLDREKMVKDIADLKLKITQLEAHLEKERETAHREAEQKDKLKAEQDAAKRKISSIPNKVIVRSPKYNCDVTDQASDGGAKVGAIKIGAKYDLYKIVNARWVELQYGDRMAYVAKTCF
jgi:chromosome segregation ATPase